MSWQLDFAAGATRAWAATYTRGLPEVQRGERRDEINADLWEHQGLAARRGDPPFGTAIEVLGRMLLGAISDILWRAQAGAAAPEDGRIRVKEALYVRGLVAVGAIVALFVVVVSTVAVFNGWDDGDHEGWVVGGSLSALSGLAVLAGLLLSRRLPFVGIGLVAIGVTAISFIWYWALVITIPAGAVLLAIACLRAWQSGWTQGGPTAPA